MSMRLLNPELEALAADLIDMRDNAVSLLVKSGGALQPRREEVRQTVQPYNDTMVDIYMRFGAPEYFVPDQAVSSSVDQWVRPPWP